MQDREGSTFLYRIFLSLNRARRLRDEKGCLFAEKTNKSSSTCMLASDLCESTSSTESCELGTLHCSPGAANAMSVPQQPYCRVVRSSGSDSVGKDKVEECRDYLRTGRCKYGNSCKYYHPPNVQSGGGMKTPLNPTEPMFPIRPNEPACQYFMKHGTCKFGQSCKFNHPTAAQQPQYTAATASPVLVGRRIVDTSTQLVALGPPGTELTHMMVQFLPQRPDQPDCIYFLRNGRCKYGANCRYHHPIHQPAPGNFEQSTQSSTTQHRVSRQHTRSSIHNDPFSNTFASKRIAYSQAEAPPGHIVVSANGSPVSFVGLEQGTATSTNATTCKPVALMTTGGEILAQGTFGVVGGSTLLSGSTAMTEQGSSASSIASSFDTASSSMELIGSEAATAQLWNRARKNSSGGSLNAFDKSRSTNPSTMSSSASDGNITNRAHSNSLGNAAEFNAYSNTEDGAAQLTLQKFQGLSRSNGWRGRSSSFDQQTKPRTPSESSVKSNGDETPTTENNSQSGVGGQTGAGRPPMSVRGRQRSTRGGGDEGFTMMTSALLNMLDTPEETSVEAHSEDEKSYFTVTHHAYAGEERSHSRFNTERDLNSEGVAKANFMNEHLSVDHRSAHHDNEVPLIVTGLGSGSAAPGEATAHWSPTWSDVRQHPQQPYNSVEDKPSPGLQTVGGHHINAQANPNDFGFYLP